MRLNTQVLKQQISPAISYFYQYIILHLAFPMFLSQFAHLKVLAKRVKISSDIQV